MTYVDSGALVPLYVPERFSAASRTAVREAGQVPFTALHQLEVRNAFEVLAGRRLITASEHDAVLAQLEDDLAHHRLLPVDLDLERVYAEACALSRRYSARFLSRSLDLLHVAAATVGEPHLRVGRPPWRCGHGPAPRRSARGTARRHSHSARAQAERVAQGWWTPAR